MGNGQVSNISPAMRIQLFLALVWSLVGVVASAQPNFNTRFVEDYDFAVLKAVAVTDTAYYASGPCGSSPWGSAFHTFDLAGNLVHSKLLVDSLIWFQLWGQDLFPTGRNSFITGGYARNYTLNRTEGLLVEYFPALDSIRYKLFLFDDFDYNSLSGFFTMDLKDGVILFGGTIKRMNTSFQDIVLLKFDLDFNLLDSKLLADSNNRSNFQGNPIMSGDKTYVSNYMDRRLLFRDIQQNRVRMFDGAWNLMGEYLTPEEETWGGPYKMIKTADAGLIACGQSGYQLHFPQGSDSISFSLYFPYIFKLSPSLEREWTMTFGSGHPGIGAIEDVCVGDTDYIVAGWGDYFYGIPGINSAMGLVAKVTESGEKIWERRIHWADTLYDRHRISSIEPIPSGGYLVGGQVTSEEPHPQARQRAWLVKIDEYGCVVPGCHDIGTSTAPLPSAAALGVRVYPNPTTDVLSVYIEPYENRKRGLITIFDTSGKLVYSYTAPTGDTTYLLDVSQWVPGMYFLNFSLDGQAAGTVSWVKR